MTFKTASVDSLMLYFKAEICEEVLDKVQWAYHRLKDLEGILDLSPSYTSLWICYDILEYNEAQIKDSIQKTLSLYPQIPTMVKKSKNIEIPTYYNGLDLEEVANYHHISIQEVIRLHSQKTYRVYAIGFMRGFAYLASLEPILVMPRRATPRRKVPKGSIAIAQTQTAIYPQNSAGGWHVIAQTDFEDFASFEVGDSVRFIAI